MNVICPRAETVISRVRPFKIPTLLMLVAFSACMCSDGELEQRAPEIQVTPNPVSISGIPGLFTDVRLEVRNAGSGTLVFNSEPTIIELDEDGETEYALIGLFENDCSGAPRTGENSRTRLEAQECAVLTLRYRPVNEGDDSAVLRFATNARNATNGFFDVEINADAYTPIIEVCAFDGQDEVGCWEPEGGLLVDMGVVTPGEVHDRRIEIRSVGTRPLTIEMVELDGVEDFSFSPELNGVELASGESAGITLELEPLLGGLREARLLIHSNDPANDLVVVEFMAVGDGPGVCMCVTVPGERCVQPTATADFGKVTQFARTNRVLHLASCGTKDLQLTGLSLVNDREAFDAELPALPSTLAPGESEEVLLSFSPQLLDQYVGRLNIQSNVEGAVQPFLVLRGEGVETGCKLQAANAVVNFGKVAEGVTIRQWIDFGNTGTEHCNIPENATVTTLTGGDFSLESSPGIPAPVAPGEVVRFEVGFTPQTSSGKSTGEFEVAYAPDVPGAAPMLITVSLVGDATERGPCRLNVQPDTSSGGFPGMPGFPGGGRALEFGNVRVGREKVLSAMIQNSGGDACTLNPASIKAGVFPLPELDNSKDFTIISQPWHRLLPGDSTTIDVRFAPSREHEALGMPGFDFTAPSLQLQTSDTASFPTGCSPAFPLTSSPGAVCWSLNGSGVRADILVVPNEIDFGLVTLGCGSREQRITLYNIGGDDILVEAPELHPAGASQYFRVAGGSSSFKLPQGGQRDLRVRFIPPPMGPAQPHEAFLRIISDASNLPQIDIPLTGGGTTQSNQTDVFTQADKAAADVLFVIDDSGSMSEEQGLLAGNARAFLQVAEDLGTDYHVAVVTTDTTDTARSGKFQGNPKIVTSSTPNAANVLADTIRALGTNGSGTERGLHAMTLALSEPLISNENAGFIRDDANLAVVVVSDEDDFSNGSVDFYLDFLRNFKGTHNSHLVKFHAIVGDSPQGCNSSNGNATAAPRYEALQKATGGIFQSICQQDWGDMAQQMGMDIFEGIRGYRLSRVLDPDKPIEVKVNGSPAAPGIWVYDSDTNNIVFDPDHIPEPGSSIEISYEALCFAIN